MTSKEVEFAFTTRNIPYLNEALLLEMTYNNKKMIVSVIYRCPSQNNCEFDSFLDSFIDS